MKLKINLQSQISVLTYSGFILLGSLVVLYFLAFDRTGIMLFAGLFAVIHIPALYLHYQYFRSNKGYEVEVLSDKIILRSDGISKTYLANDLSKIVLYMSANLDKGGIQFLPHESYHFAKILIKDTNDEIIVTCLMTSNLKDVIRQITGVQIDWKRTFFADINSPVVPNFGPNVS